MRNGKHKVIVIVGPNASGKSSLAISLAKKYNGEILSADSRQVYKGLDIATGKVTKKEMRGIPHHLIDVVSPRTVYTAADFARDGLKAMREVFERSKVPIIAGGTGFYIQALLNPETLSAVAPNKKLRDTLEKNTVEELFVQLKKLHPKRASTLKKNNEQHNKRRLVRAIEVALTSLKMTKNLPQKENLDVLWIGIHWEKDKLTERIHERTKLRVKNGMIEEAKTLHKNGLTYKRMRELGLEYKHLADYLQNNITKDELIENIITGDKQYAKRQRTWFKRNQKIHWFTHNDMKKIKKITETFLCT